MFTHRLDVKVQLHRRPQEKDVYDLTILYKFFEDKDSSYREAKDIPEENSELLEKAAYFSRNLYFIYGYEQAKSWFYDPDKKEITQSMLNPRSVLCKYKGLKINEISPCLETLVHAQFIVFARLILDGELPYNKHL